jgi:transposase
MPRTSSVHAVTTIGMDMGKNTLHMIGLDKRGAIVLREKVSRGRIALRLANLPCCLIGIEAGLATHYVARELAALGHDVKQVPPTYAKPFRQGHKNDFRDAHSVAEAVQRPTTRFVPAKTDEQLDLQALHRVRSRLVSERTAVINQIRGFLLEHGIIVRQGLRFLRQALPDILAKRTDVLSPRMVRIVADLASDWRQLDERIEPVTDEIESLAKSDDGCRRVMTVPGVGPIISSAIVAAIGNGAAFARGLLAERVLELPGVAPVSWVAVLQPEDARGDVGRHVLAVRHPRHLAVLVAEDLLRVVAVSVCALVERSHDAGVCFCLSFF